jgi:hypothetical protein
MARVTAYKHGKRLASDDEIRLNELQGRLTYIYAQDNRNVHDPLEAAMSSCLV